MTERSALKRLVIIFTNLDHAGLRGAGAVSGDLDGCSPGCGRSRSRCSVRFRGIDGARGRADRGPGRVGRVLAVPRVRATRGARWLAARVEAASHRLARAGPRPACRSTRPCPRSRPSRRPRRGPLPGCTTAKVKVAERGQTAADDVDRVEAVRDALGPAGRIRVDANGAWTVDEAAARCAGSAGSGSSTPSSPAPPWTSWPSCGRRASMCWWRPTSRSAGPRTRCGWRAGAADIVVLKVQPLGGVRAALAVAEACGLPVVVSSARRHLGRAGRRGGAGRRAARAPLRLRSGHHVADGRRRDRRPLRPEAGACRSGGRPPTRRLAALRGRSGPLARAGAPRAQRRQEAAAVNPATALGARCSSTSWSACGLARGGARPRLAQRAAGLGAARRRGSAAAAARADRRAVGARSSRSAWPRPQPPGRGGVHLGHGGGQLAPGGDRGRRVGRAAAGAHRRPARRSCAAPAPTRPSTRSSCTARRCAGSARSACPRTRPGAGRATGGRWPAGPGRSAGARAGLPGPVHLNLRLREPLIPDGDTSLAASRWTGAPGGRRGSGSARPRRRVPRCDLPPTRTRRGGLRRRRCDVRRPWSAGRAGGLAGPRRAVLRRPLRRPARCPPTTYLLGSPEFVRGAPARRDRLGSAGPGCPGRSSPG